MQIGKQNRLRKDLHSSAQNKQRAIKREYAWERKIWGREKERENKRAMKMQEKLHESESNEHHRIDVRFNTIAFLFHFLFFPLLFSLSFLLLSSPFFIIIPLLNNIPEKKSNCECWIWSFRDEKRGGRKEREGGGKREKKKPRNYSTILFLC